MLSRLVLKLKTLDKYQEALFQVMSEVDKDSDLLALDNFLADLYTSLKHNDEIAIKRGDYNDE